MIKSKKLSSDIKIEYSFFNHLDTDIKEFPNVERLFGDIVLMDFENDKETKIGYVVLDLYNHYMLDYGCSMRLAFDRSADTFQIYEAIYDGEYIKQEIEDVIGICDNMNMLVIHDLMLYNDYRGRGYGEIVMEGIEAFFTGKCGYISLQSYPKQHDRKSIEYSDEFQKNDLEKLNKNFDKSKEKLNAFYEKCGFTKVDLEYEHDATFFIKNLLPL